jgi:hypothetical protein
MLYVVCCLLLLQFSFSFLQINFLVCTKCEQFFLHSAENCDVALKGKGVGDDVNIVPANSKRSKKSVIENEKMIENEEVLVKVELVDESPLTLLPFNPSD